MNDSMENKGLFVSKHPWRDHLLDRMPYAAVIVSALAMIAHEFISDRQSVVVDAPWQGTFAVAAIIIGIAVLAALLVLRITISSEAPHFPTTRHTDSSDQQLELMFQIAEQLGRMDATLAKLDPDREPVVNKRP